MASIEAVKRAFGEAETAQRRRHRNEREKKGSDKSKDRDKDGGEGRQEGASSGGASHQPFTWGLLTLYRVCNGRTSG